MKSLPTDTRWVIVGAGFAGASTAWALGRAGLGPGVILEQEPTYGYYASGRNAAIFRLVEQDSLVRALARRSLELIRDLEPTRGSLLGLTGGLSLADAPAAPALETLRDTMAAEGVRTELLSARAASARFPLLDAVRFHSALYCPDEAIADIHALLTLFLHQARDAGFELHTRCRVERLLVTNGRVSGVVTAQGEIRAEAVIDASGPWAGRLGHDDAPLPLRALRRHIFVSGPPPVACHDSPFAWMDDAGFYVRPEGEGLLLSPCDETPMAPCDPPTDPAAAEMLAEKLAAHAPALTELPVRRSWACLRTFAPDGRPFIGPDPAVSGLFHLSGLAGFGMTTSAAVGDLMASVLQGQEPGWIDAKTVAVSRSFT